jgi:hypothetical protein
MFCLPHWHYNKHAGISLVTLLCISINHKSNLEYVCMKDFKKTTLLILHHNKLLPAKYISLAHCDSGKEIKKIRDLERGSHKKHNHVSS